MQSDPQPPRRNQSPEEGPGRDRGGSTEGRSPAESAGPATSDPVPASSGGDLAPTAGPLRTLKHRYRDAGARWLGTAAGAVIVVAGLRAASAIIIPVLVALFVSVLSYPLLERLRRRGVPLALAVAVTLLADLAVLAGAVSLVTGSVSDLVRQRATYESRIQEFGVGIEEQRVRAAEWFENRGMTPPGWLSRNPVPDPDGDGVRENGTEAASWWIEIVDLDALFGAANRAVRGVASVLSTVLIVVVITCFILLEAASFPDKLARAFDDPGMEQRIARIIHELQRYLGLKTFIGLVTGLLVGIWVALCGLNSPVLWGFVAFALNYIPNLGSIIAAVPAVLLAAIQLGLGQAVLVMVGYLVINVVIGNLVEPQVLGRRLGLSALVVFLSLVFWGWVWGPVGMLLSVPITMVVKIALENTRDLRWLAILLERGAITSQRKEAPGRS